MVENTSRVTATRPQASATIQGVRVAAYTIPTDEPEADGTYEWDATTLVVVHLKVADQTGFGYTYADTATAELISSHLAPRVNGLDVMSPRGIWNRMYRSVRNLGREGIASMAISALDMAVWDAKSRLLGLSIVNLLGAVRKSIPVYGSGGFTSYSVDRLRKQFETWAANGIRAAKMKVGTHPEDDLKRVRIAHDALGGADLYVDANGAYHTKQALEKATRFAESNVRWFEEPVSSDDLAGLRLIRKRAPSCMEIAAGEYGYTQQYFRRMASAGAVDVLQADATRCGGVTGFLNAAAEADGVQIPLSAHTAPSLHGHLCCVATRARNVEYFHDHVRIERMLFDGALVANDGSLSPDPSVPGFGLELKETDASRFQVYNRDEL